MRIAINAISVKEGGGAVVLEKLLTQFVRLKPEYEYHVIASHALPSLPCIRHQSVYRYEFEWVEQSYLLGSLWYLLVLPAWLRSKRIDVLFSQTSYLPLWGSRRSTMLVQDPTNFWDIPAVNETHPLGTRVRAAVKRAWAHYSVRMADDVTVQTNALGSFVAKQVPPAQDRIRVIPHGLGYLDKPCPRPNMGVRSGETFEVAYVALYRDYKNFDILVSALSLLKGMGVPTRLHLTLERSLPRVRALEARARELGVAEQIVNHGQLDRDALTELYEKSHALIFPSMCESFGFPQVEAMAFGLPIIAADTPVSREVCGEAAAFFPPEDDEALASLIRRFYTYPEELALASRLSAKRAANFDWAKAAGETLGWMTNGSRNGRNRNGRKPH
jgi:glycosyltransferase involved in cell wall biosynthesis